MSSESSWYRSSPPFPSSLPAPSLLIPRRPSFALYLSHFTSPFPARHPFLALPSFSMSYVLLSFMSSSSIHFFLLPSPIISPPIFQQYINQLKFIHIHNFHPTFPQRHPAANQCAKFVVRVCGWTLGLMGWSLETDGEILQACFHRLISLPSPKSFTKIPPHRRRPLLLSFLISLSSCALLLIFLYLSARYFPISF